jgi:Uncharacterised nucleotidyltransferase
MSKSFPVRNRPTARTRELKDSIIACFRRPREELSENLCGFNLSDWQSVLWWLDISGLAIYFLDRAKSAAVDKSIPPQIVAGLDDRLQRNGIRIDALLQEASALAAWFDGGGVPYALMKGITLTPESVPDSALRAQTDLDFMVPRRSAAQAVHYIRRLGYKLHATSGNTLEFRAGQASLPDLANIYSVHTQRALELHLINDRDEHVSLLDRRVTRVFHGSKIATLAPADIMVHQALHLLKHHCGEHTRLSWVLEFRRHVQARSNYPEFWSAVQSVASSEWNGDLAMGMALWIAEEMFGKTDLQIPQEWRSESLPPRIRLWMERYVRELFMSDAIGSKLYALLSVEVPFREGDHIMRRKTHKILFPLYLPAAITGPNSQEGFLERLKRYAIEFDYFIRRLRFHVVEGIRFSTESLRWKRAAVRCRQ